MLDRKLNQYFFEANKHIELIYEAYGVIENKLPIKEYQKLSSLEKFALNTLIFRFSKLQDLLGSKVFRTYLEYSGFETSDKSFFDILKELEKEGIIDIDSWNEFRVLRNQIAHEYPQEEDQILESINLFVRKSRDLIDIAKKIEEKFNEIKNKRD